MPRRTTHPLLRALPLMAAVLLTGCLEQIPGMGPPPKVAAKQKEDRAVGSACRYAARSIEDCYILNPKASKTDVFFGWKEMDLYMREHKIEGVPSVLTPPPGIQKSLDPKEEIVEDSPQRATTSPTTTAPRR